MTVRINWFPDPNITGTLKPIGNNKIRVEVPVVVNNRNWLRATSTAAGDNYAQYVLAGSQLPPAGSYHVHALAYAQRAQANFLIFYRINGSYKQPFNVAVGNGQTVKVDQTITLPDGYDQILVRLQLNTSTVGAIGMMSDILIERADTYDAAVGGGGASGLLLGGHDAKGLRRFVGRLHHGRRLSRQLQQESTHRMGLHDHDPESDEHKIQGRVRQSDRQGAEHGPVQAGRIPGEQGLARRPQLFRRGYDAARLTLLGVVA